MAKGSIVVLGILEKRGEEIGFFKKCIENRGHEVKVFDIGREGQPQIKADITRAEVAIEAGRNLQDIAALPRDEAQRVIIKGAIPIAKRLCEEEKPVGFTCLGGTTTGLMASTIMKDLPFGVPKLILSSSAGVQVARKWWGTMDVAIMQSPVHLVGLNNTVRSLISRATGAICGMVESPVFYESAGLSEKVCVALTLNGLTEKCVSYVRRELERKGYEITVFHAQGIGDRAMEKMIEQGIFDAVVDIVPRRVSEQIFGGRTGAPPEEVIFESGSKMGIPQVIAPGACNVVGAPSENKQFQGRKKFWMDETRPLSRINKEESEQLARVMAEKLNKAKGPVVFLVPLKGWSSVDPPDSDMYDAECDRAFLEELKKRVKPEIRVAEVDAWLETEEFAKQVVKALEEVVKREQ